ncbi:MAG: PfkB family carbohydrate kinase [Candidatus Desantisbacteria bacterium]
MSTRQDVLVVGSIGLDSVKTPFGEVSEVLGGSAIYSSLSASYFTSVKLVGVVGEDFPVQHVELLKKHGIDLTGLQTLPGKTFRWKGNYGYDLNEAITLDTELNVLSGFNPQLPEVYRDIKYVFLANIDPDLQLSVLKQLREPEVVVCDTMNFWIHGKRDALIEVLHLVDIVVMNDAEARELCSEPNLVKAGRTILSWGPKRVIIKKGEHGALMFANGSFFSAPAYPLENIFDPTGAGDTFAGGFVGYLASCGQMNDMDMRKAIIYGATMASFVVEDFSVQRTATLNQQEIKDRYQEFQEMVHFGE